MKAIDWLRIVLQSDELAESSWVEGIWSERELRNFESNGRRIRGGVRIGHDYFCSYSCRDSFKADAIYADRVSDTLIYCYEIDR